MSKQSNSARSPEGGTSPVRTGRRWSLGSLPSPFRPSFRPWGKVLTAAVFALAGLIFFTSFNTAKGTNIRTDASLLKLSDLIQERSRKNGALDNTNGALRDQIESLADRGDGRSPEEDARLRALEDAAATRPLRGRAITVTLNDAPPDATAKLPGYPDPQPNDLVIHQQDLQAVVNALWQGGATGMKIMDQRLISSSAVRCVGNTLILQGRVYSPPYRITAAGDPDRLRSALAASHDIQNYMLYVNAYGLGWQVKDEGKVTLPGYKGAVDLHYAQPVE